MTPFVKTPTESPSKKRPSRPRKPTYHDIVKRDKDNIVIARMLGMSYPTEWEEFIENSSPVRIRALFEALKDKNIQKLLVNLK
jgi:hypothetical protein